MIWKTHDIRYPELAQKSPGYWKLLTYYEWQGVYKVRSHSSSSSFLMSSSPITARLYSGLHHVSFCVLILVTGVDRKEVWNVRTGRNKQWTWILLNHVVAFPNPSVVKSHCTIFLLLQPWVPLLPCTVQQREEDLVLYITQLFVLRLQLSVILLRHTLQNLQSQYEI
jgi:hypothetical protein